MWICYIKKIEIVKCLLMSFNLNIPQTKHIHTRKMSFTLTKQVWELFDQIYQDDQDDQADQADKNLLPIVFSPIVFSPNEPSNELSNNIQEVLANKPSYHRSRSYVEQLGPNDRRSITKRLDF